MSEMSLLFLLRMLIMFRAHTVAGSLIQVNLYLKIEWNDLTRSISCRLKAYTTLQKYSK